MYHCLPDNFFRSHLATILVVLLVGLTEQKFSVALYTLNSQGTLKIYIYNNRSCSQQQTGPFLLTMMMMNDTQQPLPPQQQQQQQQQTEGMMMMDPPFPSHLGMGGGIPTREVTPTPLMNMDQLDFDNNADFPEQNGSANPPVWEEFDPQPCDRLQQRVLDVATNTFYKAPVLLPHYAADRAYWMQQSIRKAIFGQVWVGQLLRRPDAQLYDASITHWETTGQIVAIKQLSKQTMGQIAELTAENPRREVAAMSHVYVVSTGAQETPDHAMQRTGVMMPQDWLQDEHFCYSIMPYCDGGELFDRVGSQGRFTEDEARHWMHQILNVSGLTHMLCPMLNLKRSSC